MRFGTSGFLKVTKGDQAVFTALIELDQ
jgi:hypothetical protein